MAIIYQKWIKEIKDWVPITRKGGVWQDEESGSTFELFKVKVFAEALGRSPAIIKKWEKLGYILPPVFIPQGEQCTHWYSGVQIINCFRLFRFKYQGNKYLSNRIQFEQFMKDIKAVWGAPDLVVSETGEIQITGET